jgi:hypothetical protein
MEGIHKEFIDKLIEVERHLVSADHLVYVTFPVVKDARLLIRGFESAHKALVGCISTILKFEYLYKRVELSADNSENLKSFYKKCALSYGLDERGRELVKEMMFLAKKHKESGLEFAKSGRIIITDDELGVYELSSDKMKAYISLLKKLLENTNRKFKEGTI